MHDGHTCIQMRWWGEEGGNVYEQSMHTMSSTEKKKKPTIRPVQGCITMKVNGTKEKLEKKTYLAPETQMHLESPVL